MDPRLRVAVDASVCWYEELFALHRVAHRMADGLWWALGPPPPLHSAAKSVQPWATSELVLRRVAAFPQCSVADSFGALVLPGFDLLFEARWLYREPWGEAPAPLPAGWAPVRTAEELAEWTARHDTTGVLLPGLLSRSAITVLGLRVDRDLVAGAVVHACRGVASLSNVWTAPGRAPDWPELVRVVHAVRPATPVVGYERGEDLSRALEAGFTDVGPQLVWIR
jgi:hypothetical protein